MKRQIFPTASKYRHRTRREFGGETVEYIIVILAVVVIGGGLMGFGNQVSGQIGKTGNSISSWFGKANGAGDNASGGNGTGGGNNAGGENKGDYASIVFDNELSDIPQGNITYRWFKCAGLGSGAGLVAKELGSSPSLSLSGLQGSYINCEVTLTVNGKSKTFVPKAICNGKVSDGIYVRPRIG